MVHNQERLDAAQKYIGKNSSQSGHDGLKKTKAKRGTKFGKLLANMSFGKNVRQKKQQKKVSTSVFFVQYSFPITDVLTVILLKAPIVFFSSSSPIKGKEHFV